ncbi:MAG TPA: hypothetical protein VNI20_00660, partial [Fimbriimonadaceae bacterium]|nr:hypothetical protein [Fimbriimonadaceae bacterium]
LDQVRVGVSLVQTSRVSGDRIVNLQLSPTTCSGRVGFAAGVQDLLDQTVTTPDPHETTRSFFAASTYSVGDGVFVTLGAGTARFSKGFGNISALVVNGVRATLENDGFGWNYGAETDLPIKAEDARMSLFLGVVQSRYPTWSLSMRW